MPRPRPALSITATTILDLIKRNSSKISSNRPNFTTDNGCYKTVKDKTTDTVGLTSKHLLREIKKLICFDRDYDQVRNDIDSPRHLELYKETKNEEDLPGLGQHYCVECAKWFESEHNMVAHRKGKNHKRRCVDGERLRAGWIANSYRHRVRILKEEPHSQKTAEAVVGQGTDNGRRERTTVMEVEMSDSAMG